MSTRILLCDWWIEMS